MARGMNKVMVLGVVERGPEMRCASDGQPVTSIGVATERHWTTNAGDARQSTAWFHIVAWGSLAESASRWVREGQRVYAQGHLQTRQWEDARGQRQARTELVAGKLIPLGPCDASDGERQGREIEDLPLCLNRMMVIGNLGRSPDMRYTPDGQAVTSFSIAATYRLTAASGERRDATEWFNVISWGSLAEICHQYLSKGSRVYVEGELRTHGWEQPGGTKQFRTELVANEMIMLGPRPASSRAQFALGSSKANLPF